MAGLRRTRGSNHILWWPLVILAVHLGLPAALAEAQEVQNCQPSQYLDRTAPGADRQLTWDFSIATDPERCMRVRVGQTVVWSGDLDVHPLGGQGGDTPNPITFGEGGSITFNAVGTFGFVCLSHSSMKGAINVVPGAVSPAPALPLPAAIALGICLVTAGAALVRRSRHSTSR